MQLSERLRTTLIAAVLLGVGGLAWGVQLRSALVVNAAPLAALPHELGPWRAVDIPLAETAEAMLRADFNLQRRYVHPLGEQIEVYVGYYGTDRGGRPEHSPWVCYPTSGWEISAVRRVWVDRARGLQANEFQAQKGGERTLVHFWYRSHRATGLLGPKDQILDRLAGRLTSLRSDGALVRLSTRLGAEGEIAARTRLIGFEADFDRLLDGHWPGEHPPTAGGAGPGHSR